MSRSRNQSIGGSSFDYSGVLSKLGIEKSFDEYDGKSVIIRATFRQGDEVEGFSFRKYGYLEDYTIELK